MNTGLISIGTGGTGGHSTLLRKISPSLSEFGKVYLLSEFDCASKNENSQFEYIPITKREHQESLSGKLIHDSYKEIIGAIKSNNINNIIFSTFFDDRILEYAKKKGIRSTLITYPLRDSFSEYFFLKKFDQKFDKIIVLNDIAGTETYAKSKNATIAAYIPETNSFTDKENTIMIQCGGGGRPSSNFFHQKIDKVLELCEKELSDYHFLVSTGIYGTNIYKKRENCTITDWIENWSGKVGKAKAAISEAGYFSMHELIYTKTPSILIPGNRRTDNQELRSVKYEEKGMGLTIMPQQSIAELFEAIERILSPDLQNKSRQSSDEYIRSNLSFPLLEQVIKENMVSLK